MKRTAAPLLLFLFLLTGFALAEEQGTAVNLLKNGDFLDRLKGWETVSYKNNGNGRHDTRVVYEGKPTLRLDSSRADHTMANQIVAVKPHTRYRITGYAKTDGIAFLEKGKDGACLGIRGTYEKSDPFPATSDWGLITFEFDSKDRTEVEVGPHLGWHASMVTGTAWFADLRMEEVTEAVAGPGGQLRNGDFSRGLEDWDGVSYKGNGEVKLDKTVPYEGKPSLRLESAVADHTMANQIVTVKPKTRYRLTAMVRTDGIVFREKGKDGACLGIRGTFEKSAPFPATSDWRLITFDFDSKDRTEVEIGPHLGWHASMVTGTAWFADLKLEER
jgi:hypothetical protein